MSFFTPIDIANRALQHLGIPRIVAFTDSSRQAKETSFAIDKIRRSELRRSVWLFAANRTPLRKITATTKQITFPVYNAATTYVAGNVVQDTAGYLWISTVGSNLGNTPGAGGANPFWDTYFGETFADVWASPGPYYPGDVVYKTSTAYILSGITTATTADPASGAPWVTLTGATVATPNFFEPIGFATSTGTTARNVFPLPANFIRIASQDPKAAAVARLGVTAGMQFNDWELESGFLFTNDASPIILRFVADQTNVAVCDDLFNEAWAAHLGIEVCDILTQSRDKLQDISALYNRYIDMAKLTNSIEAGSTESEIPEGGTAGGGAQPAANPQRR